jgi:hypothetical protein
MTITAILLPVFVLVAVIFCLLIWTGRARIGHIRQGDVKVADVALGQSNWPTRAQQVSNTYANQFELPMLFFLLVAFALITRKADILFVVMSWMFVVTRIFHAGIYVTSNRIQHRFTVFLIGAIILFLMWIIFALRIFAAELGV